MSARRGRLRTLNSRMLIWLSVMLIPVIAGGVVGIVMQQRQIHETRATAQRVGTMFLKIDRAFVDSVADTTSEDHGLVRTIVSLGQTRGLIVVAQGVEHAAQRDELERLGCELGQGYLFCRPLSADDLVAALGGRPVVAA
jgi:hypothetical protein